MKKNKLLFCTIVCVVVPLASFANNSTSKLHELANQGGLFRKIMGQRGDLTEADKQTLKTILADPEVKVNETRWKVTPLQAAILYLHLDIIKALLKHPDIDLTYAQMADPPLICAVQDPELCRLFEEVCPYEKLLKSAIKIKQTQKLDTKKKKALEQHIECWRQKLAISACLEALRDKTPQHITLLLRETLHPPAPAA